MGDVPSGQRRLSAVPPQHGAWAFLGLPVVVGICVGGFAWPVVLLAVAWTCAYPVSYFTFGALGEHGRRNPRRMRYARPAAPWAAGLLLAGVPLLALQPWLALVVAAFLVTAAASGYFAVRHRQRALANDAILIVQCSAMVPITWAVAQGGPDTTRAPAALWWLTGLVMLALTSSTLHVRSLLRGRDDPRIARTSLACSLAGLVVAALAAVELGGSVAWLLTVPFGYFVARSVVIRRRTRLGTATRPAVVGLVDLLGFALLAVAAAIVS